jgi:predicted dinucleotide-binding enzyme
MSYAIIGFGKIGQALAKAFARNGIEVSVATTRDPESFASDTAAIGPTIILKKLAEAVKADVVFLAVRFEQHPSVAQALPIWQGKTIVDVTNAYGVPPEKLEGQLSAKVVAQAFAGARLVKGFNHLGATVLGRRSTAAGGSCSWRVTMTAPRPTSARSPKISGSRRSTWAGFRRAECSSMGAATVGAG